MKCHKCYFQELGTLEQAKELFENPSSLDSCRIYCDNYPKDEIQIQPENLVDIEY